MKRKKRTGTKEKYRQIEIKIYEEEGKKRKER